MPTKQATPKAFWPCGGSSGKGCGRETWGGVSMQLTVDKEGNITHSRRGKNYHFHNKCAEILMGVRNANGIKITA